MCYGIGGWNLYHLGLAEIYQKPDGNGKYPLSGMSLNLNMYPVENVTIFSAWFTILMKIKLLHLVLIAKFATGNRWMVPLYDKWTVACRVPSTEWISGPMVQSS